MLKLAPSLSLPIDVAGEAIAILAKRGAGKTNTATVLVEEMIDAGVQVVILDPVGAWWGLRSSADGKGDGLAIPILGGQHGDVPLESTAGALIADVVVDTGSSLLLDLSDFPTKAAMQGFVLAFAEHLYRRKARAGSLLHLVLEEADLFAPQSPKGGFKGNTGTMTAAIEALVRRGRSRGIGLTMVTQRSAVLNKDVLTQADVLIAMRATAKLDRQAIEGWVETHDDKELGAAVVASLPTLDTGEAWVWNPEHGVLERVKVRKRSTFDSSATPKAGERRVEPTAASTIDLASLGQQIAATAEKAKENDPAELRKRIRSLERDLAAKPADQVTETVEVEKIVEVPVLNGQVEHLEEAVTALRAIADTIQTAGSLIERGADSIAEALTRWNPKPQASATAERPRPAAKPREAPRRPAPEATGELSAYAIGLLETLAARYPMKLTRAQISTFSGRKPRSSAFSAAMAEIIRGGYVNQVGSQYELTDLALGIVDVRAEAASPEETIAMWRSALPGYEASLFDALIDAGADGLTRDELAERTGRSLTSSAFSAAISTLAKNGLVETGGGLVRISGDLVA